MPTNIITNTQKPTLDAGLALMKQTGQDNTLQVVVENPKLAGMPSSFPSVVKPPRVGATMPTDLKLTGNQIPAQERAIMQQPFTPPTEASQAVHALPKTEMQAHPDTGISEVKQSYLRLRVRVTNNQISVVSANVVDGPLAQPSQLIGQHAYEVVLDSQQLVAEGLPDVGESRSYPRPGQNEHNITSHNVFEFNVRIPHAAISTDALARLKVNLYRFPDALPKSLSGKALLSTQYGAQAKLIANFDGFKADRMEAIAIDQLKTIYPSLKIQ